MIGFTGTLILFSVFFVNGQNNSSSCGEPDCSTYVCLEDIAHCGSNGYLIGYGYKNCLSFNDHYDDFNQKGKNFTDCATYCLPNWLEEYFEAHNNSVNCRQLQQDALQSHVKCFLDCGFCGMWFSNLITLAKVLDFKDFLSVDAVKTVFEVFYGCLTGQGK
ncbi:unnamed protein product [Bursaphelenchus xylophilus]|uniref:(pine wood nematode) hypothetical protein n=1 Tax=Bursaphelenchus xylophilus TaxID=6326 RepID=A0A1I7S1R5_BURXY|nr:unnamed protein product [Bursaphelenchus xylophilus]CAG9089839.1 unnamed protein product [Bursaphelenchus xylophilus]